jgi:hypothetical protein
MTAKNRALIMAFGDTTNTGYLREACGGDISKKEGMNTYG